MSDETKRPEDKVIVIPHREGRLPRGIIASLLVIAVAGAVFATRSALPDWRGLAQETGRGLRSFLASKAPAVKPPVAVAKANPKPMTPQEAKPSATEAPVAVAKAPEVWEAIQKAADKLKAEQVESERQKAEAAKEIDEAPLPPPRRPFRRWNGLNPAALAEMQRRQEAMIRQMEALMARDFEQGLPDEFREMGRIQDAMREHFFGDFAGRGGPGTLPPGLDRFAAPLPGMDRFATPLPGQPKFMRPGTPDVRKDAKRAGRGRGGNVGPNRFGGV